MLVGACTNMAPERFHVVIAEVPFVDVLNTICDDTLPLTPPEWPEWGNPIESEAAYDCIAAYSPYDNVEAKAYPHIIATAGLTDPRVTYWEFLAPNLQGMTGHHVAEHDIESVTQPPCRFDNLVDVERLPCAKPRCGRRARGATGIGWQFRCGWFLRDAQIGA